MPNLYDSVPSLGSQHPGNLFRPILFYRELDKERCVMQQVKFMNQTIGMLLVCVSMSVCVCGMSGVTMGLASIHPCSPAMTRVGEGEG